MGVTIGEEEIHAEAGDYRRVNLGYGDDYLTGWYNVDLREDVDPDAVWDFDDYPWPFPDDYFTEVLLDIADKFDTAGLEVDKVRWAKWLPDDVALWLADTFGLGVSGFPVTVTPTPESKSEKPVEQD